MHVVLLDPAIGLSHSLALTAHGPEVLTAARVSRLSGSWVCTLVSTVHCAELAYGQRPADDVCLLEL